MCANWREMSAETSVIIADSETLAHTIVVNLRGMEKGQFLLTLAMQNPDVNYIGIERYSSVLLRAVESLNETRAIPDMKTAYSNLRFICMDARSLTEAFAPGEADRIYLNFSDPWPKARHAERRQIGRAHV